jgi:hypothetical protein
MIAPLNNNENQKKEDLHMKKVLTMAVLLVIFMAGNAFATPITLTNTLKFTGSGANSTGDGSGRLIDSGWGDVNRIDGFSDFVTWSHSFTFPAGVTPVNGRLTLNLRDDSKSVWDGPEFAIGFTNAGQWAIGEVDTGEYRYNVRVSNGGLVVTLASVGGDFFIDSAILSVSYNRAESAPAAPVPEPATMSLLGLGMIGAGIIGRRKKLPNPKS